MRSSSLKAKGYVPTCLVVAHLAEVQAKIADLKRIERVLKDMVAQCGDCTLPVCPLIETLFRGRTAK